MIEFTRTVRENFKNLIKEFETTPIHKEHVFNYFPGDLITVRKKSKDIKMISK
jgi:hypothetical protein